MNTKFVLGLPRANQVGLEHAKKRLRRCERWLEDPPPPLGMSMLTDSTVSFFEGFPKQFSDFFWQFWTTKALLGGRGRALVVKTTRIFNWSHPLVCSSFFYLLVCWVFFASLQQSGIRHYASVCCFRLKKIYMIFDCFQEIQEMYLFKFIKL